MADWLSEHDLKEWRRSIRSDAKKGWQRVSYTAPVKSHPAAEIVDGDTAGMKVTDPKPQPPNATYRKAVTHVLDNLFSDPERIRRMVAALRQMRPEVEHLSDSEIVAWVRRDTEDRLRESVGRVYHQTGRDKELQIKVGGV